MKSRTDNTRLKGVPGRYWHFLDDGRIQCDLCPRYCKLREGQRGLCFVRGRQDDRMLLTTYGRSSGFCIDPIEKKPLNHFLPGTPVLSFGTAGCNLTCKFCQNWEISTARQMDRLMDRASPEQIVEAAIAAGARSIAYTYNDPVIFLEYAVDVARIARERGLKNVAVTAGYIGREAREEFFHWMDAANIDLKAFTEDFYHRLCTGHLKDVLETLEYVRHETGTWLELTTLLIPGKNDGHDEVSALSDWVAERLGPQVPLHFSAFHPDNQMQATPSTPRQTLTAARDIATKAGLWFIYTGNVHDRPGQSTYCPGCHTCVIGRDWYDITSWALTPEGRCEACGSPIGGVFEAQPGTWGNTRMPLRISAA
ncbi:radical SAM protein [Ruegeria marisrubri]|uniref:Radical SAM protein n=1 Tax=Ruegeria marisrubri TaxID=1685379 RepID=A0A0X3UBN3_9RHOB|nr:AmmeMemoRadiSam system radical SAM enzyme [Ruegeria marisrubri]KUJ85498.1 radical SAM protein [Ruegeria marisrubri]